MLVAIEVLKTLAAQWRIVVVAALLGGSYYWGWTTRGDHDAAAQVDAIKAAQAELKQAQERGDALAAALEAEKANIKTVTVEVVKEIPKVTTVYRESPGAPVQPIPAPVFTRGFVGLWNSAYVMQPLSGTSGKPASEATGADSLVRAGVDSADLLANHAINASSYAECRRQLNALIDWHESIRRTSGR